MGRDNDNLAVEQKFWIVTGYSTWQTAKAMARKAGCGNIPLRPGVWHEVISE